MVGRDDRLIDPMQMPRAHARHQAGVPSLADQNRRFVDNERFDDGPVLTGFPIGWQAPLQGANHTITSTTDTAVNGSTFRLSFEGAKDSIWLVNLHYRGTVFSTGAIGTDVFARILIDWLNGDGLQAPDIDVDGIQGRVTAFGPTSYGESVSTGGAFELNPKAVFEVRGGSTIRVALGIAVGAGQSAVIHTNNARLGPHCCGTAVPHRRVR